MDQFTHNRLVRVSDGFVAGVCGGVARRFGWGATLVRLVWIGTVLLFGTGVLLYFVLWWLMPQERNLPVEPTVWLPRPGSAHRQPLARTVADRKVLGVCGGLARRFGVDPVYVRLAALVLATASAGIVIVAYTVAAIVLPATPDDVAGAPPAVGA